MATLAVSPVCRGGGSEAGGRSGSAVLCCETRMGPATPALPPARHLLGRLGVVLQPLHRHDAALQVCPAANGPLQRLGHLVREDPLGQLQQDHPEVRQGLGGGIRGRQGGRV